MGKKIITIVFIGTVLFLFFSFSNKALSGAMFRSNSQHTGIYDTKGIHQLSGIKWKFKAEGSVFSSPAIVDRIVYFGSALGDIRNHQEGYFYALDTNSGQVIWRLKTECGISASPAIAEGIVYFGNNKGYVYALQ